ncbi:embryo-specific protein ATS3A-like [Cornus florida]|uniref:embryo-specific protein ATS3A-like n=1 Tax=Cornus florida TaxID=4283 RepID=UPI0028A1F0AB|nr:embryo-specific protein ATS3A-like [Cornus florida]
MVRLLPIFLLFAAFLVTSIARSITPTQPHFLRSFKIKTNKTASSCPYTVIIKTSCSSTSYTRDKVSLAFGDSYGKEVYAPRLDDPYSRTFERCSTDTFQIRGPCAYEICYLYMLRSGSDGWKPESVKIYGPNSRAVTFYYNTFLPNGVWFGFNHCNTVSLSAVMWEKTI